MRIEYKVQGTVDPEIIIWVDDDLPVEYALLAHKAGQFKRYHVTEIWKSGDIGGISYDSLKELISALSLDHVELMNLIKSGI